MKDLLSRVTSYLISPNAPATSSLVIAGLVVSGILLLIGLLAPLWRNKAKQVWLSYVIAEANVLRVAGLVWVCLFFLRFEAIWPFSYRAWVYAPLLPLVVWAWVVYRAEKKKEPLKAVAQVRYDHYEKYLPSQKRTR